MNNNDKRGGLSWYGQADPKPESTQEKLRAAVECLQSLEGCLPPKAAKRVSETLARLAR